MINKGHWILLPADMVLHLRNLRLSPLGVVPQRDRRPRTISDYTFFDVNADTAPLAPKEAMQFGRALHRILQKILQANPRFGPVYLSKIDISDGFYRVWLLPRDIPNLGVLFPQGEEPVPLIGFPLALPMGWINSPPYFSAATETACDMANRQHNLRWQPPPHRLDSVANSRPPTEPPVTNNDHPAAVPSVPRSGRRRCDVRSSPLRYTDVYVDDYINMVQGNRRTRRHAQRTLFHCLDEVFRGLDLSDSPHRQEPASVKKLRRGDGAWTTRKLVLGWLIDTVRMTIELPPHRVDRLHAILASIPPTRNRVGWKEWHKVLGKLRSMALAIPGGRGLFSTLQEAFQHPTTTGGRLKLGQPVHDFLNDFRWLARELTSRPTRIAEIIPDTPASLGACDASGDGMGGVHFVPTHAGRLRALLWRGRFAQATSEALVSYSNPKGTINNSELELAGTIAHHDVLAHAVDIRECTIHNSHDNTAAVYWQRKGSTTTTGPTAYLLRLQALHERCY